MAYPVGSSGPVRRSGFGWAAPGASRRGVICNFTMYHLLQALPYFLCHHHIVRGMDLWKTGPVVILRYQVLKQKCPPAFPIFRGMKREIGIDIRDRNWPKKCQSVVKPRRSRLSQTTGWDNATLYNLRCARQGVIGFSFFLLS